jgi:hypothetical protein
MTHQLQRRIRSCRRALVMSLQLLANAACERYDVTRPPTPTLSVADLDLPGGIEDSVMGALSPVARIVALGLASPGVRAQLAAEFRRSANEVLGVDLADCTGASFAARLYEAASVRSGLTPAVVCEHVRRIGGLTLYMNPDRVRSWRQDEAPMVTAFENLPPRHPPTIHAYRPSGDVVAVDVSSAATAPLMSVLPLSHQPRGVGRQGALRIRHPSGPPPAGEVPDRKP